MARPNPLLLDMVRLGQLDGHVTEVVVASAAEHGLLPMVHEELAAGRGVADIAIRRRAAHAALSAQHEAATRRRVLSTIADTLGPEVRLGVGKGLAFEHHFYDGRCLRTSSDVDIYFDGPTRRRIGDMMRRIDPSVDAEFFNSLAAGGRNFEAPMKVDGVTIDVHHDIINLILPTLDVDRMWAEFSVPIDLDGGPTVWTFDLEMSLALALIHLARDGFATLKHILDVRLMLERTPDYERLAEFAGPEGWMPIIRNAHHVVSTILGRNNPLPPSRASRLAFDRIWPLASTLGGRDTKRMRARRQSVVSALVDRRRPELSAAIARRLLPPRAVIDARHGVTSDRYLLALYRWRRSQARGLTRTTINR